MRKRKEKALRCPGAELGGGVDGEDPKTCPHRNPSHRPSATQWDPERTTQSGALLGPHHQPPRWYGWARENFGSQSVPTPPMAVPTWWKLEKQILTQPKGGFSDGAAGERSGL